MPVQVALELIVGYLVASLKLTVTLVFLLDCVVGEVNQAVLQVVDIVLIR